MKKYFIISLIAVLFISGWISLSLADTQIQRGKSAAAGLLPDELKSMRVDDYFVESKSGPAGSIQSVTGYVVVVHKDANRAYFAAVGDTVYQHDVFYTLKDSRCRIKFSTEDIVTMGENSKVVADEIVDDQVAQKKSSVISMLKGKAMFYVVRLFKYKTISASVKTPTAVMGVRGTKFGVEVRKSGEKVADLSDGSFIYLAQNEPGNFETVVYGFDGEVEVNSTGDGSTNTVGAGETLVVDNLGSGGVEPTDPNSANQFIGDTEGGGRTQGADATNQSIKETEGGGGTEDTDAVEGSGGGTESADAGGGEGGSVVDTRDNTSESIAQTLTSTENDQTENVQPPYSPPPITPAGPTDTMGYFTAMLTKSIDYTEYVEYSNNGVFVSHYMQDIENGTDLIADDIVYGHEMHIDGSTGKLTSVVYSSGSGGGGITGPYPVTRTLIGQNAYMEWGYWTQTTATYTAMPDTSDHDNWVNNRGYYIAGDYTPDISALNQVWTYSGGAEGTYWTANDGLPGGGINMTGAFNAIVDFTSDQIIGFDLTVSGGVHNVAITDATGSFDGVSSSQFTLNIGSDYGTATINGAPVSLGEGYGSVYGPAAEAMGGVWGVKKSAGDVGSDEYATGIFHGTR